MKQWLTLCDEINVFISSFSVDEMSIFFSRNNFYYFYIENITFSNRLTSESKYFNKVESLLESGW